MHDNCKKTLFQFLRPGETFWFAEGTKGLMIDQVGKMFSPDGVSFRKMDRKSAVCIESGDAIWFDDSIEVCILQCSALPPVDPNPYASPREVAELADGDLWYHELTGYCLSWFIKFCCTIIGWAAVILAWIWIAHPRMTDASWWACLAVFFAMTAIVTVIDKQVSDQLVRWKR